MPDLPRLSQSPTDPGFVQDPYPFYDRARGLGPLFHWDEYGFVCTTTFEATQALLKDRCFGRAPLAPPKPLPHLAAFQALEQHSLLELEAPSHTRLRKLVVRAFTSRQISGLAPQIEALAHHLIDAFPSDAFDLLPAFATPLPVTVIARLLGVPEEMSPQLLDWSNRMVAMYQARQSREIEDSANAAAKDFIAFLQDYVDARRSDPRDDLITELIAAEEDGERLSTEELISICVLLLNAGHEATVHTIGNGAKALIEAGVTEISDITIEEVMRYDPPLHLFTRICYEDLELFGHVFRRGDTVGCLLGAAGRDPAAHPEPGRFNLARPKPPHLALGAGLHFCVGAPLARLELQIALRILFERCPSLQIVEPPRYGDVYHFHGLERLMVRA